MMMNKMGKSSSVSSCSSWHKMIDRRIANFGEKKISTWVRGQLLAEGEFASVFVAETKKTIKRQSEIPPVFVVKSAIIKNAHEKLLKYEKRILCDLKGCPNVVTCYGDEETESDDGEKFYNILLEYCACSLFDRLFDHGCGLPESEVRFYTRDIVLGLKYIHSRYYVHCDIKLDNILLVSDASTGGFHAKIADFGLAEIMCSSDDEKECSELKGSYRYMSPEMVKDKKIRYVTDIWALGCVVVEMLSRKPVWNFDGGDNTEITRTKVLHCIGDTLDIPEIPSGISEEAKDFLEKCLVRSVEHRWSADMLIEHPFLAVDKC